jgi:hypothetical protein
MVSLELNYEVFKQLEGFPMKKSASLSSSPDSVSSKLLAVDSDLATQEHQLAAQLEALQEKRKSLQTVIHMFSSDNGAAISASAADIANGFIADSLTTMTPASESDVSTEPEEETRPAKLKPGRKSRAAREVVSESTTSRRMGRKPGRQLRDIGRGASKSSKKSVDWQPYVRQEFRDRSLPQAVLSVLQQYPNETVEVPNIISTIFVDDIPKQARLSARDRLSNVLSVGLRTQKWYRGKTGHYSVSREAARASMVS